MFLTLPNTNSAKLGKWHAQICNPHIRLEIHHNRRAEGRKSVQMSLGDGRGTEFLVEDDVAASGAEGCLHGAGDLFHTLQESLTGGFVELQLFSHSVGCLRVGYE